MVKRGRCQGWMQQRTNLEKTLLSLSCLLILTLLLLILIGVTFHGPKSDDVTLEDKPGCWSAECINTASHILSKMNEERDPCSNFYEYSCGNYGQTPGQTNSVSQSSVDAVYLSIKRLLESSLSTDIENFDSVKSLYSSCMEFDGLHRVRKESAQVLLYIMELYGLGSWPVVETMYEESGLSLSDRLSSLTLIGVPVAFKVEVIPDPRIEGSYLLKLSPGGPLEVGRTAADIIKDDDLRTYMLFSFLLLGTPNYLRATSAVDEILSVDAYYATVEHDIANKCDSVDTYTPEESLGKLNSLIPEMNWTSLLVKIQKEAGLKRPFAVELHCKSKIRDYVVHLKDLLAMTLDNYLGWRFFESFSKHIGPAFRRRQPSNRGEGQPRWRECVKLLEKYATPVLARGLTPQNLKEHTEEKIHQVVKSAQSVTERLVSQTRWLNNQHKSKILRQVQAIKPQLPYVKKTNGSRNLQLSEVNKESYSYTYAVIGLRREWIIEKFKILNPSMELKEIAATWEFPLTSESVSSTMSSLAIFLDKLREPYFRLHGSDWMNYGGVGIFVARELSKILLSEGMGLSIDDHTSLWDLWSSNRNASACLLNLFSERFGLGSEDDRENILKELFLDASSLEIGFESAKTGANSQKSSFLPGLESKSGEQMFFIAYAQTLCEANRPETDSTYISMRDRVNTLVANSQAFDHAFSCSSSTSSRKCQVWT